MRAIIFGGVIMLYWVCIETRKFLTKKWEILQKEESESVINKGLEVPKDCLNYKEDNKLSWLDGTIEKALQSYESDLAQYVNAKKEHNSLLQEIEELKEKLKKNAEEEKNLKEKIAELGGVLDVNPEEEILSIRKKLEQDLSKKKEERATAKLTAEKLRNEELAQNDNELKDKIKSFDASHPGMLNNLSETEQKALEFAQEELGYVKDRDEKIRKSMDHTETEKDAYDRINERCTAQIEQYIDEYEPDLSSWQDVIDEINERHMPDIEEKRNEYKLEEDAKKRELDLIDNQIRDEEKSYKSNKASLTEQFEETDEKYERSIEAASLRNEPTVQLEISQNAALNRINDELHRLKSTHDRDIQKLKNEEQRTIVRYDNSLAKIQNVISKLDALRLDELAEPQGNYDRIKEERDKKIAVPDSERNQALNHYNKEKAKDDEDICGYKELCNKQIDKLHEKMKKFAMEGDNCLSEKYQEVSKSFRNLELKADQYKSALEMMPYKESELDYMRDGLRTMLHEYDYEKLVNEAEDMGRIKSSVRSYYKYARYIWVGGILLDAIIISLLKLIAHWGFFGAVVLPSVVILIIIFFMFFDMPLERDNLLKAQLLATEYQSFEVINEYANELATSEEFDKLKNIGQDLLNQYKEHIALYKEHDEKEALIRKHYTETIETIEKEYNEYKKNAKEECDNTITSLKNSADSKNSSRDTELCRLKAKYSDIKDAIQKDSNILDMHLRETEEQKQFFEFFMKDYEEFIDKYLCGDGIGLSETMANSEGVLNDNIYLVSTGDEGGEYGKACSIKHINHNKNPYLVLYAENQDNNLARQEMVLTMITDLLLAYKSINSKEIYKQYIIDSTGATTKLRKNDMQNLFNISQICNNVDEMKDDFKKFIHDTERMLEHGQNIDNLNRNRSANQAPNVYKIVYFVFQDEPNGRLSDDVVQLLKYEQSKDTYGFLPVFICPKQEYEDSLNKNSDNLYSQISCFVEDRIVIYENEKYDDYAVK